MNAVHRRSAADDAAVIAIEQEVLGILLSRPDEIGACDDLQASDFIEPSHGVIFTEIAEATKAGRGVSPSLLAASVGTVRFGDLSPMQYVMRLVANATTTVNLVSSARSVRDASDRRRIVSASQAAIARVTSASWSENPAGIAAEAIAELDAVVSSRVSRSIRRVMVRDAAHDALTDIEKRRQSKQHLVGSTWGLRDMDNATLGMIRGDMVVLAGRPSMGKSAVALSAALASARAGHGVLYVSQEMTADQLALRALTDAAWSYSAPIRYSEAQRGSISDDDLERLIEAQQSLQHLPLLIEPQPGLTVSQIVARARRVAREMAQTGRRLDLVVIDHMGLIKASNRYAGNKVQETTEVSNALKPLAKELDVAVLALCQFNRSSETGDDKRPSLSALRWSGAIEEDADVVVGVYRESYHLERKVRTEEEEHRLEMVANQIELSILKQRMGPTATITAYCDIASNVVRDLERRPF